MPQMQLQIREAKLASVRQFPTGRYPTPILFRVAVASDEAPPWWNPSRDAYLRTFWKSEGMLASAVFSLCARNAGFRWEVDGEKEPVEQAIAFLKNSEFGEGWQELILKVSEDLLSIDNGAFIEIIRPARATVGGKVYPAIAKRHRRSRDIDWFAITSRLGHVKQVRPEDVTDSPYDMPLCLAHMDGRKCLGRDSRVLMADGTTRSILRIVRERNPGPVLALDSKGELVPSAVTAWYETPLGSRSWLHLRLANPRRVFGKCEGLWLTNDHPVLTPDGWAEAETLEKGDLVTTKHPAPSLDQAKVLVGGLLGDVGLGGMVWPKIDMNHCLKQEGWLRLKAKTLRGFAWNIALHNQGKWFAASSRATPGLLRWRELWYPDYNEKSMKRGTKILPREMIKQNFSPLMLAVWYGDDGNMLRRKKWGRPAIRLYTNCFSRDEVEWLASLLSEHGYSSKVYSMTPKQKRSYYIYITPDGSERFWADVAPYLPPCLRYKLPDGMPEFQPELWANIKPAERFVDIVESVERGDNGGQATTFCIDVENHHNFSAASLMVHNCTRTGDPDVPVIYMDRYGGEHELKSWQVIMMSDMPSPIEEMHGVGFSMVSRVLRNAQVVRDWTIFRQEKISGRFARAVHLTNVDSDWISDAIAMAKARDNERGLLRYSQPIITNTLDPSSRPYLVTIPLAELPDGFSEDETMRWYIALLALAAGEHYSFLAPMPGRRLGSAREVEVQERQARGKSSRLFMEQLSAKINSSGVLPSGCVFSFGEKDPEERAGNEEAERRRAETRKLRIESGEITPAIARQIANDQGDLRDDYLKQLGEEDTTPEDDESDTGDETVTEEPTEEPVEEKQKELSISKEDMARAIGKWNERIPEAEGSLQATETEDAEEQD